MKKRASAPARALAAIAVIGGFVLVFGFLVAAMNDDGADTGSGRSTQTTQQQTKPPKDAPAKYEVKEGDTLSAIARSTGVPVAKIEQLNPGVDPQILEPGEKLKLR